MSNEHIARYQIQSEIGRGGMAVVYLAYDPNFRRNVAIKRVAGSLQAETMYRDRFEREARLIARIEHPAIVPVYDYGEHQNDLYLVMRYMTGGSLADRIGRSVLTLHEAAAIVSQIAPALDAVHSQGIVHRDLKPGNILFDGFGNPAVSDFGIAHFTAATADLTGSAIIGTPSYMSPEQVRGEADIDGRSDIYALGVILFEMLSRHRPFQSATPLSLAFKHLTDPIPSILRFRPDLPPEMDPILNRALAKDRELRYPGASALALDLRTVASAVPETDVPRLAGPSTGSDAATEVETGPASVPAAGTKAQTSGAPFARSGTASSQSVPPPAQPSRKLVVVSALAVVGVLLFLACGSLGLLGTWAGLRGMLTGPSPTEPPAPVLSPTTAIGEVVVFADDFADPNSGWPAGQNAHGSYGYGPDGYHIRVNGIDQVQWVSTDRIYDNASLSVDATLVVEGAQGYYGLLCRIQDPQNFYYFVIQSDGSYTAGKYRDGVFMPFLGGWQENSAIAPANRTNRIRADCTGDRLRMYVNEAALVDVQDPDFTSGLSGILAAALDDREFEVRFNNFQVTKGTP